MSKVDPSKYNKFFDYPTSNEITILNVVNGDNDPSKNLEELVAYDSENQLFWVCDCVKEFRFKDGDRLMIAFYDRLIASDHDEWVVFSLAENRIKDYVMRKLGYPVVRIELTLRQIKDCIDDTVKEMAPWIVQLNYATVTAASSIDMSEYDVSYVINVIPADRDTSTSNGILNGGVADIFAVNYYEVSGYREALYRTLELGQLNRIQSSAVGGVHWNYIANQKKLMVDVGSTGAKLVTVIYSPNIHTVDDLKDDIYKSLANQFALAFARETLSNIRGKFTVDGSPVSLDADAQHDRSSSELERLRQEMKDTVSTHFMID